jgi:hypothetical protein
MEILIFFPYFILDVLISDLTEADIYIRFTGQKDVHTHIHTHTHTNTLVSEKQKQSVERSNNMLQHDPFAVVTYIYHSSSEV